MPEPIGPKPYLLVIFFLPAAAFAQVQGGLGGVVVPPAGHGPCISAAERARVEARLGALPAGPDTPPSGFAVFPQAGTLGRDLYIGAYLDHDPTPGILDWHCTSYTYNTHAGADSELRSFGEQVIGVPVFAAADGVVVATDDGHPDMNTTWAGQPANYVIIDHGGGRLGYYWHLRNGSVAVSPGQAVKAGHQVGQTASSGNSAGPHLHFEVREAGVPVDPWAGPCSAGPGLWKEQPAWNGGLYLRDFAVCRTVPSSSPYPFAPPRDAQWVTSDPTIYFWALAQNVPANSTYRIRFKRPDGTLSYETPVYPFNNPLYQYAWWWWNWNIWEMHTITGTWTIELEFNGQLMIAAPVEVVSAPTPGFNRPPAPVTAAISPAAPTAADVLVCRVDQDLVLDDLDWDIVRFTYTWRVDGVVVRTLTSAGRADMLPHHVAAPGSVVTCEVVPSDGVASAPAVTATTTIRTLGVFPPQLSLAAGGAFAFTLDLGPAQAAAPYVFAGSLTGTAPGIPVGPGLTVPLVFDALTSWNLAFPNTAPYADTYGALGPLGAACPRLVLPGGLPPALAGLTLHHAAFVAGTPWSVTNAATCVTVP